MRGPIACLGLGACALVALDAAAQGGTCAEDRVEAAAFVSTPHTLPRGAAILLAPHDSPLDDARLVAGEVPHSLEVETIADGLVLLRIPEGLAAGDYELRGITFPRSPSYERPFTLTDDALPEPPPAPRLSRLHRDEHHDHGDGGMEIGYRIGLDATLRGDAPDRAAALLGRWTSDDGERIDWAGLTGDPITLASIVPCAGRGEVPDRGTSMRFRYVDRYGQLGAESAARRVR